MNQFKKIVSLFLAILITLSLSLFSSGLNFTVSADTNTLSFYEICYETTTDLQVTTNVDFSADEVLSLDGIIIENNAQECTRVKVYSGTNKLAFRVAAECQIGEGFTVAKGSVFTFSDGTQYTLDNSYTFTYTASSDWTLTVDTDTETSVLSFYEICHETATDLQVTTNVDFSADEVLSLDGIIIKNNAQECTRVKVYSGTNKLAFRVAAECQIGEGFTVAKGSVFTFSDGTQYTLDNSYTFTYTASSDWNLTVDEEDVPGSSDGEDAVTVLIFEYRYGTDSLFQVNTNLPASTPLVNFLTSDNGCSIDQSANQYQQVGWIGMANADDTIVLTFNFNSAFTAGQTYFLPAGAVFGFADGNKYVLDRDYTFTFDGSVWTVDESEPEESSISLQYRYGTDSLFQVNTNLPASTPLADFLAADNGCVLTQGGSQKVGWIGMANADGTIVLTFNFNSAFTAGQAYTLAEGSVFSFTDGSVYQLDGTYTFTWDGTAWSASVTFQPDSTPEDGLTFAEYRYGTANLIQINTNLPSDTPTTLNLDLSAYGSNIDQSANQYQQFTTIEVHNVEGLIVLEFNFAEDFTAGQSYVIGRGSVFGFSNGEKYTLDRSYVFTFDGDNWSMNAEHQIGFENVEEEALAEMLGVEETDYSAPSLALTEENTEDGKGVKVTWSYDGEKSVYEHRFVDGTWSDDILAGIADYRYFRIWISNPGHTYLDLALQFYSDATVNYYDMDQVKLISKDGLQISKEVSSTAGLGEMCSVRIPKQFSGWVVFDLTDLQLKAAEGYTDVFSQYADATGMAIITNRVEVTVETGDYYVLDNLTLSDCILGQVSTDTEETSYDQFDITQRGNASIENIIFLIGDGMGDGSLDAARLVRSTLYMDTITNTGYVNTDDCNGEVTDSGAAGTALSTGYKTDQGVLGLTSDGTPVLSLAEYMKRFGMKTGLVTTSYLADATPAAFVAHTNHRSNYNSVIQAMFRSDVDVLLGGGSDQFQSVIEDENGNEVTLENYAQTACGYQLVNTKAAMEEIAEGKILGLFTPSKMSYTEVKADSEPTLAEMTQTALKLLENEKGFFVMIEGGRIDHANHDNLSSYTQTETLAFDDAVKIAMDYVDTNENTLLIITADHETGGVSVVDGSIRYATTGHTGEAVPYYAYGAGAEYFTNLTENTQISDAIKLAATAELDYTATTVADVQTLADTDAAQVTQQETSVLYTAQQTLGAISLTSGEAKYAVLRYKASEAGLTGKLDDTYISYVCNDQWNISDIIPLTEGTAHSFSPFSYIREENYKNAEIAGVQLELSYIAFFHSYENAAAFQARALLYDESPALSVVTGWNLVLNNKIGVNFVMLLDADDEVTCHIGQSLLTSQKAVNADGTYTVSVSLAASQMTDEITVSVNAEALSKTYSVAAYAAYILDETNGFDTETVALVEAMLRYGAAAQEYFDYNTDKPADAQLEDSDLTVPSAGGEISVSGGAESVLFNGVTLCHQETVWLRFYFNMEEEGTRTFFVNGTQQAVQQNNSGYYVQIGNILPQDLDEDVTVAVSDGTSTLQIVYSPLDYIIRMYNKAGSAAETKELVKALYGYYLAAEEYIAA